MMHATAPASARARRIAVWVVAPLMVFALARFGAATTEPSLAVAPWWPAVGVTACFLLLTPRHQRPFAYALAFVAIALANLAAGTALLLCLAYAVANVAEIMLLMTLLYYRRPDFRLATLREGARFIVATAIAATCFGVSAGLTNTILSGGDFGATATVAAGSHAAAVLLIAPFGLLPLGGRGESSRLETATQWVLLALAIAAAWNPHSPIPLYFLVFALLSWSVLRFPPATAFAQSLTLAVVAVALNRVNGAGIFLQGLSPVELALTTVTFLCTIGVVTVSGVSSRYEDRARQDAALTAARAIADAERETTAALRLRHELDRQREDFVATTSHELRTPVTIIAGYTSLLNDVDLPAAPREWVTAITRNTARLSLLLSNLLTLAHPRDEPEASPDVAPAADLVAGALGPLRESIDERKIALTVSAPAHLNVFADRDDAKRILRSLVSNAVKFSPEGSRVSISVDAVADGVAFRVVDEGPGLDEDVVEHIFEPFYRGSDASIRATAGAGLGLPVARMLTRRNGGDLQVATRPDTGLQATLWLPGSARAARGRNSSTPSSAATHADPI